jgi:hypothetical protein
MERRSRRALPITFFGALIGVSSEAPSTTLRVVPLPHVRGEDAIILILAVRFLIRVRNFQPRCQTARAAFRSSSDKSGSGEPASSRSGTANFVARIEQSEIRGRSCGSLAAPGFRFTQPGLHLLDSLPANKKEAERRQAQSSNFRTCKVRRASDGTRTPSGVPLRLSPRGQLVAPGSASGHASGDSGGVHVTYGPPSGEDHAPLRGRYPRRPVTVQ